MQMQWQDPYASDDPSTSLNPDFTTIMLRNIPNKYTTKMLLNVLDRRFARQYDYVYLPVDFVNHCNVGYAFVNLKSAEMRVRFARHFHNQKVKEVLPGFNSKKVLKQVCEVNKAKVQGAKENIRRIKQMNMLMTRLKDHPDWVPLLFDNEGNAIPLDLDAPIQDRSPPKPKPKRLPFPQMGSQMAGYGQGMMPGWDAMANSAAAAFSPYGGGYPAMYGMHPMFGMDPMQQAMIQQAYSVAMMQQQGAMAQACASPMSPEDWSASVSYSEKDNSSETWGSGQSYVDPRAGCQWQHQY